MRLTDVSPWWDHTGACSSIWLRNSNFSARRTNQFQRQKCFSVLFNCFNIAGLLRKKCKKWLALPGFIRLLVFNIFSILLLSVSFELTINVSWEIDATEQSTSTIVPAEAPISGGSRNWCFQSDFCYKSLWGIHNYLIVISVIQKTLLPSLKKHFGRRMWRKNKNEVVRPPFHWVPTLGQSHQLCYAILRRMSHSIQRTKVFFWESLSKISRTYKNHEKPEFWKGVFSGILDLGESSYIE